MYTLDIKDRKILYQLDLDSRQSFRSIGRKVGLSKDTVAARVKKLEKTGVIKGYYPVIDYARLGYSFYRFYFAFQNVNPSLKNKIITYFVNEECSDTVVSIEGNYDLMVAIWVKNFPEAYSFWRTALQNYGVYFSKRVFTAYCQEDYYGYRFLLDKKDVEVQRIYRWFDTGERVEIDDVDQQIISLFSQDTRIPLTDIGEKVDRTSTAINHRLKKLMQSHLIIGYRVDIDLPKVGYYIYKIDLELIQADKLQEIIDYIAANPHLFEICTTIGYVDLELVLAIKNTHQLYQIMEDLSNTFPESIKNYSYFTAITSHKTYGFDGIYSD